MNGKTDLLKLNPRYADGRFKDLTQLLDNDQELIEQGAKNLGATIFKHYKNLNYAEFQNLVDELNKILKKNAADGKRTFIYI